MWYFPEPESKLVPPALGLNYRTAREVLEWCFLFFGIELGW